MKVRVKFVGVTRSVEIGEGDQCTLSQLREKASEIFQLVDSAINLSLNKKDILSGEDDTLSQLGIVSGDLLFILCQDQDNVLNANNNNDTTNTNNRAANTIDAKSAISPNNTDSSLSSSSSATSDIAEGGNLTQVSSDCASGTVFHVMDTDDNDDQGQQRSQDQSSTPGSSQQETVTDPNEYGAAASEADGAAPSPSPSPLEDPEVNRCLQEPLLCRESTYSAVPALLQDLYNSAACVANSDALWVVLHALMMEMGFRPLPEDGPLLAEGWNKRGFYQQDYRHLSASTQHTCSILGVSMGTSLILHGVARGEPPLKTESQNLKVSDYVYGVNANVCRVYKNLERLSRIVKDLICQPLLSHLSEVCGFPVSLGLLSLSYELKLKVLSYLPAVSLVRMGQVCREYSLTYKDPCLWRRLYLREFGQHGDNSLQKDWYTLYREQYLQKKERRKLSRQRHHLLSGIPPWLNPPPGHFPPLTPSPYPGGIIGGDYDLNPEFAPRIPHPLFGQPPGPNPFIPQGPGGPFTPRPRFSDPFGPGAFPGPTFLGSSNNTRPSPFGSLGGNRFI